MSLKHYCILQGFKGTHLRYKREEADAISVTNIAAKMREKLIGGFEEGVILSGGCVSLHGR